MSGSLQEIGRVHLPRSVAETCHAHLAAAGSEHLEGMALWAGVAKGDVFEVREAIIPDQQGIRTEHGLAVTVSGDELHRINMHLYRSGQRLLAQIHSHPGHAFHSSTDDEYAIATALGSLSLVVPNFATEPFKVLRCATYRLRPPRWWQFTTRPTWTKVPPAKADAMIRLVD
ncbi:MAG: Mov34/MPN/PAD-1 family protein [Pseudomonadota bacterium]|nr:Mov34/MPN/PAD-1 family protein [Pseudomonadota bacterium]